MVHVENLIYPHAVWMEGREGRYPAQYDPSVPSVRVHTQKHVGHCTPWLEMWPLPLFPNWHSVSCVAGMSSVLRGNSSTIWIWSCEVMPRFSNLPNSLGPKPPEQESDIVRLNHGGCYGEQGWRAALVEAGIPVPSLSQHATRPERLGLDGWKGQLQFYEPESTC